LKRPWLVADLFLFEICNLEFPRSGFVSYFGDTLLGGTPGTCDKSGLKSRVITSQILGGVRIQARREGKKMNDE
jgi:hypothetical protein